MKWFFCDVCRKVQIGKSPYAKVSVNEGLFGPTKTWEVCEECFNKAILPIFEGKTDV